MAGVHLRRLGTFIKGMLASSGVRFPFLWLHLWQAVTRFSQDFPPPRDAGNTWSSVSSLNGKFLQQYWHLCSSLRKILSLESRTVCLLRGLIYTRILRTAGTANDSDDECASAWWVTIISALSWNQSKNAFCQLTTRMGSYVAFSTRTLKCVRLPVHLLAYFYYPKVFGKSQYPKNKARSHF